jgi:hypothetical protein
MTRKEEEALLDEFDRWFEQVEWEEKEWHRINAIVCVLFYTFVCGSIFGYWLNFWLHVGLR